LSVILREIVVAAELAHYKRQLGFKIKDKQLLPEDCPLEGTIGV